jgi:deazaflavin-dependent oxidoreductase (nitroreductase family)
MPNYRVRGGELRTFEDNSKWTYVVIFKGKEHRPGMLPFRQKYFDKESEARREAIKMYKHLDAPPQSAVCLVKKKAPRRVPTPQDDLKSRLARYREIKISVIGRKSGNTISIPVWFVLEGEQLFLLPVGGSDTQWYKNVLKNPSVRIDARGAEAKVTAKPITESAAVKSVVEKFREKYGAKDVKKYYSKFDVAVSVELG